METQLITFGLLAVAIALATAALFKRPVKNGYETLTETIKGLSLHVKELEIDAAAGRGKTRRLEEQVFLLMRIAQGYITLRDQLERLGIEPDHWLNEESLAWLSTNVGTVARSSRGADSYSLRTEIKTGISLHFSLEELAELCLALGLTIDDFAGGKSDRIGGIVDHFDRRGELSILLQYCIKERPRVLWPTIPGGI